MKLIIVVPCYNEEEVLGETNRRLLQLITKMRRDGLVNEHSGICYVDDGSRDRTWSIIDGLATENACVHGLKLSRNCGHQNALLAGLSTMDADAIVSIDADLQDDVAAIERMVQAYHEGAEVVYGVRDSRQTDTGFKRNTALMYYSLMKRMGVNLVHNHADFRLLSRRAVEALRKYDEVNIFLRGIVPLLGYKTAVVKYDRGERFAGISKYPLRKMLAFAIEGITSFSVVPLRLITLLGFAVSGLSFLMILYIFYGALVLEEVVPGWASSVLPIYFLGGIQLLSMGIIGEYVSKIYLETKRRPRFFIESSLGGAFRCDQARTKPSKQSLAYQDFQPVHD